MGSCCVLLSSQLTVVTVASHCYFITSWPPVTLELRHRACCSPRCSQLATVRSLPEVEALQRLPERRNAAVTCEPSAVSVSQGHPTQQRRNYIMIRARNHRPAFDTATQSRGPFCIFWIYGCTLRQVQRNSSPWNQRDHFGSQRGGQECCLPTFRILLLFTELASRPIQSTSC